MQLRAALAVVEYVGWFNHDRLHEALGDLPPAEFEQTAASGSPSSPSGLGALTAGEPQPDPITITEVGNQLTGSPQNPARLTPHS